MIEIAKKLKNFSERALALILCFITFCFLYNFCIIIIKRKLSNFNLQFFWYLWYNLNDEDKYENTKIWQFRERESKRDSPDFRFPKIFY